MEPWLPAGLGGFPLRCPAAHPLRVRVSATAGPGPQQAAEVLPAKAGSVGGHAGTGPAALRVVARSQAEDATVVLV